MRGWGALSEKCQTTPKKSRKFHPEKTYVLIGIFGVFRHENSEKHILEAIGHLKKVENSNFRRFSILLKNFQRHMHFFITNS